jgi:hypothetical protein
MERTTYRTIVRSYAHIVADGHTDADLKPRERRLVEIMLNTASNATLADQEYATLSDIDRERIVRTFIDGSWNANVGAIVAAVSPASRDAFGVAMERTVSILRGI